MMISILYNINIKKEVVLLDFKQSRELRERSEIVKFLFKRKRG